MIFDAKKITEELIEWIRKWFDENGKNCNAVIGISGGKDSSICAALCVEALGKDRVIGIMMPNINESGREECEQLVNYLGIETYMIPVTLAVANIHRQLEFAGIDVSEQTMVNLPPRIRMATLYAVSQSLNGRVINTCNLSEDWVGYSTRYGDAAGDVSPLGGLTVQEVKMVGRVLGLPQNLIEKIPDDGLCGKTDEENLGFSYKTLDEYIRTGRCDDDDTREKIDYLHNKNLFKLRPVPVFSLSGDVRI